MTSGLRDDRASVCPSAVVATAAVAIPIASPIPRLPPEMTTVRSASEPLDWSLHLPGQANPFGLVK
ncbi:hypothetical protein [Mycobacterium sp. 1165178.9]|uniref:hypothetical protein n=1 Tax=Mycobacterium sp. 1165178.9 TaxID=1834070 RepID=UPI000AEEBB4B|nr:hypothetical protein [Mycobacterium sp. 1165178.9]